MPLIKMCLSRPVGVSVGVLLLVLFGLLSLFSMPVQLTPDVDTPIINITTPWSGANPQEVEREIVDRQEEQLRSVKGLRKMTSSSSDGMGSITLEFYPDIDKTDALNDVIDKMNRVAGYPLDMDEPMIAVADTARDSEIAWLILSPKPEFKGDISTLYDFAIDEIKPYLDRIEGVGSTDVYGGREQEVRVLVDAGQLAARGLTFTQLSSALRQQNANISAGTRPQGKRNFAVRTVGQYESSEEILSTVIAYTAGGPVYVRDVATVERTHKRPFSFVRSMGEDVLAIPVRREVGKNVMTVMTGVRAAVDRINEEVLEARGMGLELRQVYDETHYISQSIATVRNNIIYGGTLAAIVLMLFLRSWRATAVVVLSIPISVIGTFLVFAALGRTVNVISLAGMAFAVGMVVDSAVVVLENIYRHRQLGHSISEATLRGTSEVWGAVLAGTLTTVAVFVPVIFVQQEAGQLFRDISVATVGAVSLSLIVSVTVIPVLAGRLMGSAAVKSQLPQGDEGGGFLARLFAGITHWLNASVALRIGVVLVIMTACVGLIPFLIPPTTYLPSGNRNLIFGGLSAPPGYSIQEFRRLGDVVEGVVAPYWETKPGSAAAATLGEEWIQAVTPLVESGAAQGVAPPDQKLGFLDSLNDARARREWLTPPPMISNFFFVAFGNNCFMGATSADDDRVPALARLFDTAVHRLPGIYGGFQQTSLFRFGGGNNVEVELRGDDIEQVRRAAEAMQMACMQRFQSFPMANPPNFNLGRPELRIVTDRERAADLGLNVRDVGTIVEACVDGAYVGDFRNESGDTIDISVFVQGQREEPTQMIGQVPIYAPTGEIVPLSAAVRLVDTSSLEQINHIERQRAVSMTVRPPEAMALETVVNTIRNEIEPKLRNEGQIASRITVALTGNADRLTEARNTMVGEWRGWSLSTLLNVAGSRFFLSVLIVYLLMAALYESWLYPLVIMFSVPMAVLGGFIGLWMAHIGTLMTTYQPVQQLDVLTFLGFVILVGIVVNNAILLVNQSLHNMRDSSMSPHEAIREAVRIRVRPVFMTTLTTFFGQLPLAVFPGAGSELYRGLASVMLGGLLVATIGTLIVVPAVLALLADARAALARSGSAVSPATAARDR